MSTQPPIPQPTPSPPDPRDSVDALAPELERWEQQPGESDLAYGRFLTFLHLERYERGIKAAWKKWQDTHPGVEDPLSGWHVHSSEWAWKARAAEYDRILDKRIVDQLAHRRMTSAMEIADLGKGLRTKAAEAMRLLQPMRRELGMHDGKEIIILATTLTPEQIVRMADVGVKLEQLAIGQPTERTQLSNDPASPVGVTVETAATVLRQKLEEIRTRRAEAEDMPT